MEEAFDMYRQSMIGVALIDTLDKMVASDMHSPELAMVVVVQFDKIGQVFVNLQARLRAGIGRSNSTRS